MGQSYGNNEGKNKLAVEYTAGCERGGVGEREEPSPPPQSLRFYKKMPAPPNFRSNFADEKHLFHRAGEALKH